MSPVVSCWPSSQIGIGAPERRIGEIPAGKRAIAPGADLRPCRFFGLPDGWWLWLRAGYDAGVPKALAKIKPWKETAEHPADARRSARPLL